MTNPITCGNPMGCNKLAEIGLTLYNSLLGISAYYELCSQCAMIMHGNVLYRGQGWDVSIDKHIKNLRESDTVESICPDDTRGLRLVQ